MRKGGIFNLWQIMEEMKILQVPIRPPDALAGKPYRLQTVFDLSSLRDTVSKGGLSHLSVSLEETEQFYAKRGRKEDAINDFASLKHFIHTALPARTSAIC